MRDFEGKVVVIIDVLRATTTILTAFANGCKRVIPVLTPEEAMEVKYTIIDACTLLGGERRGIKINGFDLGNSPSEYTREVVQGQNIVLTTTNGTKALRGVRGAGSIFIGALSNISALCRACHKVGEDIILVTSGRAGSFSLEDLVCAGMIVSKLRETSTYKETDAAFAAQLLFSHFKRDIKTALYTSEHGRYLCEIGFESDLEICAQVDTYDIVPFLANENINYSELNI